MLRLARDRLSICKRPDWGYDARIPCEGSNAENRTEEWAGPNCTDRPGNNRAEARESRFRT